MDGPSTPMGLAAKAAGGLSPSSEDEEGESSGSKRGMSVAASEILDAINERSETALARALSNFVKLTRS